MGKKKKAAAEPLSKKQRKKLEEEAARLEAELAARKKAAKKKGKKGGKKSKHDVTPPPPDEAMSQVEAAAIADAKAARKAKAAKGEGAVIVGSKDAPERHPHLQHLDRVGELLEILANPESKKKARAAAEAELAEMRANGEAVNVTDPNDAAIRARVKNKQEARALGHDAIANEADSIDRSDADAVRAYNERAMAVGAKLLTSDAERERIAAQVAAEVQTEKGREFVVGTNEAATDAAPTTETQVEEFAKPSEAERLDFDVNGNGQYKVKRPSDGKLVGYTRMTTYIDAIEDSSRLVLWKLRTLLEGVAAAAEPGEREDAISELRDLAHRRDAAIAKARKADRKGKLEAGELAQYIDGAERDYRNAVDKLADELLDLGGAKQRAQKGTDLHALFEIVDTHGLPAIHKMRVQEEITDSDVRDCVAYSDAISTLGAKIIDIERPVVIDEMPVPRFLPLEEYGGKPPRTIGVAGRLDRTALVRLPGRQRATRVVLDVKTGSTLEYSAGKTARQLHGYSIATGYNLETHEREDLKLDKKVALVVHVPAGTGVAHVHLVDLTIAAKGNKVVADVRAMRNEGKKAIDLNVDLLDVIRAEEKGE